MTDLGAPTRTPVAVTIAGSDSSGGAGVQADLKTFAAFGVYGASVVTALTAQNTRGVFAVHDAPADFIAAQIDAVFSDLHVAAIKIGMLSQKAAIEAVASGLARYGRTDAVLDPVMVSTNGDRLLAAGALDALKRLLIPQARLITPNLPEAAALLETAPAESETQMQRQAEKLIALGARAVLIKGGHGLGSSSVDLLVSHEGAMRFEAKRIATKNTHGTGCTLSSAIAAGLARGLDLAPAIGEAKAYVTAAIAGADRLAVGSGSGPLDHFHHWRERSGGRAT